MSERSLLIAMNKVLARLDAIEALLRQEDDELVGIAEAARLLGKTPNAVRQMVHSGKIGAEHAPERRGRGYVLRFRRGELKRYNNQTRPIES